MNAQDDTNVEVDERFMGDWIAFGIAEMESYLAKHAAFERYVAEHDADGRLS